MPKAKAKKMSSGTKVSKTAGKVKRQPVNPTIPEELSQMVKDQFAELSAKVSEQVNLAVAQATTPQQLPTSPAQSQSVIPSTSAVSVNLNNQDANAVPTHATSTETITPQLSLQGVVESLLQSSPQGELTHLKPEATFDIPLGAGLPQKIREKIVLGDFVDLYTVLFPHKESQQLVVNTYNGSSSINIRPQQNKSISSIDMWTSAMMTYGAVYLNANPVQAPKFLKYIEFIRSMQRNNAGWGWKRYDEVYRRTRIHMNLDWDQPLINQYFAAISGATKQHGKPFRRNDSPEPKVPRGYCVRFHTTICKAQPCKWKHQCFQCNGNHSITACTQSAKR